MSKRDIIVIGASAGGILALVELVNQLPGNFEASVFVVQHLAPYTKSILPTLLSRPGKIEAVHPKDGEKIRSRQIYVAPPDHHLLIEKDLVLVKRGPKENRFRPSIDALFRSAAYSYRERVIGVVLSGLLDDGTSGLWSVKRMGGLCVVQDPFDAEYPSMPESVLEQVEVDHMVPIIDLAALLQELVQQKAPESTALSSDEEKRLTTEIHIASQDNAFEMGVLDMGPLTPFTCPECNGTLVQIREGQITRFRCHTGHAFTENSLLSGITKTVEENLWEVIKGMEEAIMLLEQTGEQMKKEGRRGASAFFEKAKETRQRVQVIRDQVFRQDQLSNELIENKGKGL